MKVRNVVDQWLKVLWLMVATLIVQISVCTNILLMKSSIVSTMMEMEILIGLLGTKILKRIERIMVKIVPMLIAYDKKNKKAQVFGNRKENNKLVHVKFMQTSTNDSLHSIPAILFLKTNHKASLLCDQTIVFFYHKQTSGLTAERLLLLRDYTRIRCRGHSLVLRASAPS